MAKIPQQPDQLPKLKAAIREKCPERLYIFHGEETFLLQYYLEQLKKLIVDPLTESFNFHKLNSETFSVERFANAVENLPMMAERTMVVVDDVDLFKLAEADRERLTEIFSDIGEYCTVVFVFETIPWKPDKRFTKFWNAICSNGTVVGFAKQDRRDLTVWITRHFAANGKHIKPELCGYLIDITGGTMTALSGEISKLSAYSGAPEIQKSDIDAVVEPVLDAVVFDMTDHMGRGNYEAALWKLQQLLKMQQEPTAILGAIGQHFRRISVARILLNQGKPASEMMRICGIQEYPAKKNMTAAARFTDRFCQRASELILETDRHMKTSFDDPHRLLEVLVMELAQEARNG